MLLAGTLLRDISLEAVLVSSGPWTPDACHRRPGPREPVEPSPPASIEAAGLQTRVCKTEYI